VTLSEELLREADCVLILTDHPEFDYQAAVRHARLIIDTRQAIAPSMEGPARVVRL
jgi:UDP-N-acetyl-D-glucosamine dehydrogenase